LVRLEQSIAAVAREYIRVRVTNMRGVNLDVFDFDYDLDFAILLLTPDQQVIGRFSGRGGDDPGRYLTFPALRYALEEALKAPRPRARNTALPAPDIVENYPAIERMKADACVHCHNVYDFRRQTLQQAGKWRKEMVWVYPLPDNLGIHLDPEQGNRVESVDGTSAAGKLQLKAGDVLQTVNGVRTASFADVQYALQRAPATGGIVLTWTRAGVQHQGTLQPGAGWRETDLSWRASTKKLGPAPSIHGEDLPPEDRQRLGLGANQLAMVLGAFQPAIARQAGLRQGDIIVGADDRKLALTARQFEVYVRLNYQPGQKITYNLLRAGQPAKVTLTLPASGL
jgi:membrane-associated protease RseP (regulator of RpoE activity)